MFMIEVYDMMKGTTDETCSQMFDRLRWSGVVLVVVEGGLLHLLNVNLRGILVTIAGAWGVVHPVEDDE